MVNVAAVDILVVEDNPHTVELICRELKRHHFAHTIWVVHDGAEALDFLFGTSAYTHRQSTERPKLVLLDLKLPKVDGLAVLRKIKADECTKCIPVVVLTSSQAEKDIEESYTLGVNSYVIKPGDFDHFRQCISAIGHYWLECNTGPRWEKEG